MPASFEEGRKEKGGDALAAQGRDEHPLARYPRPAFAVAGMLDCDGRLRCWCGGWPSFWDEVVVVGVGISGGGVNQD